MADGNMGDKLMFLTVIEWLRKNLPDAQLSTSVLSGGQYQERIKFGLYQLLWPYNWKRLSGSLGHLILSRYRKSFGIVTEQELDYVLDFTGYRYADIGLNETIRSAKNTKRWKKYGVKTIFLPQAFGPFTTAKISAAMKKIIQNTRLIYARDKDSYKYLISIDGTSENIVESPDITISFNAPLLPKDNRIYKRICIIPNCWMVYRTTTEVAGNYINYLSKAIEISKSNGFDACIVIHSGFQDRKFAAQLLSASKYKFPIIEENDPLHLKGLIGQSQVVLSSRYHGLIAGLSQGIPSLGTSWAHKYKGLFEDYNCIECLLKIENNYKNLFVILPEVLKDGVARNNIIGKIHEASKNIKIKVDTMWASLFRELV